MDSVGSSNGRACVLPLRLKNRIRAVLYEFHDLAVAITPGKHGLLDTVVFLDQTGELAVRRYQIRISAF